MYEGLGQRSGPWLVAGDCRRGHILLGWGSIDNTDLEGESNPVFSGLEVLGIFLGLPSCSGEGTVVSHRLANRNGISRFWLMVSGSGSFWVGWQIPGYGKDREVTGRRRLTGSRRPLC